MGVTKNLAARVFASCAVWLAAGCSPPPPSSTPETADNVIDAVLRPMLTDDGITAEIEDDAFLCRRLSIDLDGIPPSPFELEASCLGKSPREMALYFMNKPTAPHVPDGSTPYVWVNRRWWADAFQYQSTLNLGTTWLTYVRQLDGLVADLYAGRIGYDEFARRALASPGFARRFGVFEFNHDLVQLASQAWRIFFGREALPSEAADFGNLWRGWSTGYASDAQSKGYYPAECASYNCEHYEVGLTGYACAGVKQISCESTVLGSGAVLPSQPAFVRWDDLLPDDRDALEEPGRLMAERREFAEAAVDRALTKYLGWWKTSVYRPDSDIPAVRDALVAKFIADGFDIRALELEIVSSLLYAQRANRTDGSAPNRPLWSYGPIKMVYAEAWLDSVALATGKALGGCDFRFSDTSPDAVTDAIPILYRFGRSPGISALFYADTAHDLGGCPIATVHGSPSGLVPAVTRRVALARICPGAFVPSRGTRVEQLVHRVYDGLGRPPTPDEMALWLTHIGDLAEERCISRRPGDCDLQTVADQLCQAIFATAQFNYY